MTTIEDIDEIVARLMRLHDLCSGALSDPAAPSEDAELARGALEMGIYTALRSLAASATQVPGNKFDTHPHAALMPQYAMDEAQRAKPWAYWEYFDPQVGSWRTCISPIHWNTEFEYRRKLNAPPLSAPQAATQVPQGWKLVPVEPTEAMHVAAARTIVRCTGNYVCPPRVWQAMLSASPPAPQAATQGEALAEAEFDRELADTAMRFVDRAGDTCETDTAERICAEFHKAMSAVVFKYRPPHSAVTNEPAPAPDKEKTNG